ncbi:MAG: COX15/CtaA family protein [Flavobacterium sp.]|nr:COX15/CtaA family protein [Flavobacterium sp.]
MKKYFLPTAKTALVLIYLVIMAGALVRMTGSGMGCPDWPKCFGYYIPPTDVQELTWTPDREFEKGQVIIKDEQLLVATSDFTTKNEFNPENWREYTKHDYAIFNPTHTWIEYINRLAGALAGLATLIMAILSFGFKKVNKRIIWLSWLSVFLMGFQGWLGATVVYSVLNPVKITLHMIVALLIVALVIYIIRIASPQRKVFKRDKLFTSFVIVALILTMIQVITGTQVRQFVDEQIKLLGYDRMSMILSEPTFNFYFHRTFSILVFVVNLFLYLRNRSLDIYHSKMNWVMAVLLVEIASGIAMYYFDFPFGSQAIHLFAASILFGIQIYLIFERKTAIE